MKARSARLAEVLGTSSSAHAAVAHAGIEAGTSDHSHAGPSPAASSITIPVASSNMARPFGRRGGTTAAAAAIVASLLLLLLLAPKLLHVAHLHDNLTPQGVVQFHHGEGAPLASAPAPPPMPTECPKLSRGLLEKYAKNGTVMITFTDHLMFRLFGSTWLHNVRNAGITYWVLAVADNRTADLVLASGAGQCFMAEEMEVDDLNAEFNWGGKTWLLHTWQKVLVVRHVNHLGFNVMHSDMDVVWFRDPLPYFLVKYTTPDYFVSMDPITTRNNLGDDGPEAGVTVHHYMNTGVYFLRNTTGGRALIDKWYDIRKHAQRNGNHDQDGLYKYLTQEDREQVQPLERFTWVVGGKTRLAQMPATQFQNGYSHCINKIHKVHELQPYETHFVWVYSNNNGKMHRMREFQYFYDPPEYYASGGTGAHVVVADQGKGAMHSSFELSGSPESEQSGRQGFLSVELEPIETPSGFNEWSNVTGDTEPMVQHHLKSLEKQLSEVYHAIALAYVLNRTLILPKIQCWCIQNWFESPLCRLPGELLTQFPMDCPADYVFNLNRLYSIELNNHRVPIREYSFLDNPRTPQSVKDRPLMITLGDKDQYDEQQRLLQLPASFQHYEGVAQGLAGHQAGNVHIRIKAPLLPTFAKTQFKDAALQTAFDQAMSHLPVKWCCRPDVVLKAFPQLKNDHQIVMARVPPDTIA